MSAYIRECNRYIAEYEARIRTPAAGLQDRFVRWYTSLPPVARDRRFSMGEFESALGRPGRFISPVLVQLGWQRRRAWSNKSHYLRYWIPPEQPAKE